MLPSLSAENPADALLKHLFDPWADLCQLGVGQGAIGSGEGDSIRQTLLTFPDLSAAKDVEQREARRKRSRRLNQRLTHRFRAYRLINYDREILLCGEKLRNGELSA